MVEKRRRTEVYWLTEKENCGFLVEREGELWFISLKEKEYCGLLVEKRRRTVFFWLKREEDL